jgi:two-component system, NtrC family, sensor histidine kinase PilS
LDDVYVSTPLSSLNLGPVRSAPIKRREIYFFSLYRVLVAGLFAFMAFSPFSRNAIDIVLPWLAKSSSLTYLIIGAFLMWLSTRSIMSVRKQTSFAIALDLACSGAALFASDGAESAICLLLLFNIAASALILTPRVSFSFALAACGILIAHYVLSRLWQPSNASSAAEMVMFCVTYLAIAVLFQQLNREMSASAALAEKRGEELANMSEINELVIRRMRTGLLVVDGGHRIRLANEAVMALLGNPSPDKRLLSDITPVLHESLWKWRRNRSQTPKAMTLADGAPEVLPRFVSVNAMDNLFLVFLDDSRIYSVRAEELTLSTLGRLSASIAHEIRNPLAAISYSTQLLEESQDITEGDKRLLEIIHTQCQRMNGIVQNILGLARRERSQPESIDLNSFARKFVEEYRLIHPLETDVMQAVSQDFSCIAMADPQQLHQVLTVLVHNALTYGRAPGQPAQVKVSVYKDEQTKQPIIDVIDRGPGIPTGVAERLFTPFYTTSEHGTGLGLYIAQQLCEANLCTLAFVPIPGGGACFRIGLPISHNLMATT